MDNEKILRMIICFERLDIDEYWISRLGGLVVFILLCCSGLARSNLLGHSTQLHRLITQRTVRLKFHPIQKCGGSCISGLQ